MLRPGLMHAVERLLGPAAPELGCDECFAELDRYVELELFAGAADVAIPGMAAHLAGCPACQDDYKSLQALVCCESALGGLPGKSELGRDTKMYRGRPLGTAQVNEGGEMSQMHLQLHGAGYMRPDREPLQLHGAGYMRPDREPLQLHGAGYMFR